MATIKSYTDKPKRKKDAEAWYKEHYEGSNPQGRSIVIGAYIDGAITWFKKQGEQKPANKIKPQFEIGDLITNGTLVGKVDEIHDWGCHAYFGDHYADVPDAENWHKWSIKDAKNGDVLQLGGVTAIFKELIDKSNCRCYCSVYNGEFEIPSQDGIDNSYGCNDATPATKEQRDTLIKAMAYAGYTFDFKKKELKKIGHNPADVRTTGYWHIEDIEQKSAKSKGMNLKEKEMTPFQKKVLCIIDTTIEEELGLKQVCDELFALASNEIKQKPVWNEEDENMLNLVIKTCEQCGIGYAYYWLKSLKDRYTCKPSDGQIKACKEVYADILSAKGFDLGTINRELNRLEEKLKKYLEE